VRMALGDAINLLLHRVGIGVDAGGNRGHGFLSSAFRLVCAGSGRASVRPFLRGTRANCQLYGIIDFPLNKNWQI
jgi:hypothetical protein